MFRPLRGEKGLLRGIAMMPNKQVRSPSGPFAKVEYLDATAIVGTDVHRRRREEKRTNIRAQKINQSVRVCSVGESGCATALDPSAYAVCRCCLRKMSSGLPNAQPLHRHTPSGASGPHGLAHHYQRLPVSACHSGKSLERWLSVPWSQSSPRRLRQPPFPLVAVWG